MAIERRNRRQFKKWFIAVGLVHALPLFLVACGQNAHVTRPDLLGGGDGQIFPAPSGGGNGLTQLGGGEVVQPELSPNPPVQQGVPRHACPTRVELRVPLRAMSDEEIRGLELPYRQDSLELRTLGMLPSSATSKGSASAGRCGSVRSMSQVVFAAELKDLPPRYNLVRVNSMALEMKIIRPATSVQGDELLCLVDERICSGLKAPSCGANDEFWGTHGVAEAKVYNRSFISELKNERIWRPRTEGPGKLTSEFQLNFRDILGGSRSTNLETFLYQGAIVDNGLVHRSLRFVMIDDLIACSGEVVLDLEVDACGGSTL